MTRPKGSKNKPKEVVADLTGTQPRLPYPPDIAQRFGFDPLQWKVLVEAILPEAKSAHAVIRVLSYCKTCAEANRTGRTAPDSDMEAIDEVRDGDPPPRVRDPGPVALGPIPHTITGKGETCESWAEKYGDMLKTSNSIREFELWRSFNAEPLELLTKRKPSVAAAVRKVSQIVLQALTDEEEARRVKPEAVE